MTPDSELTLTEAVIHDLSTDGRGVARVGETVYFVERGLPGDQVRLRLAPDTRPPSAEIVELLSPSPHRLSHPCPHAGSCPGSLWGSLSYERQLKHKQELVARTLRKAIGEVNVLPTVPSPFEWHYRNRVNLTVWTLRNRVQIGYQFGPRQESGIPINTCKLAKPGVDAAITALTSAPDLFLPDHQLPQRIQLHQTARGGGALLIFPAKLSKDQLQHWEGALKQAGITGGVWFAEGTRAGIVDFHRPIRQGKQALPVLTQSLGVEFEVHPATFTQANAAAAALVEQRLSAAFRDTGKLVVWDLYGGFGALGIAAAATGTPVHVFEISPFAETALQTLASRTGHRSVTFHGGDLLRTLRDQVAKIGPDDLVLLDPPRSGAHPDVLAMLARSKVREIVYLSCNPARLGRDLALLRPGGFVPYELQPYDFFPQTPATEVLALLRRD